MFGHLIRDIVNNDDPVSSSVVAGRDGAKPLLTGRVPLTTQTHSALVYLKMLFSNKWDTFIQKGCIKSFKSDKDVYRRFLVQITAVLLNFLFIKETWKIKCIKKKKSDVLSSMVTHTRNWSSAFNPSKCTHTAVSSEQTHTHCEHTPGAVGSHCSSARGAVGGSVPCSRAPQPWYWRRRECCSFTIPTFNPCRTWDSNPQPLDYKSDSLTIRPRLPRNHSFHKNMKQQNGLIIRNVSWAANQYIRMMWHWRLQ